MTKRVWKPFDVLGMRFYSVRVCWPNPVGHGRGTTEQAIVAAQSPSDAARIVAEQYKNLTVDKRPSCRGEALNVCQPVEWIERRETVSPLSCKHERRTCISSSRGTCADGRGGGDTWRDCVTLCLDCGLIEVNATKNGQRIEVSFGLNCDDHVLAAANYMRSPAEARDVIERRNRLTDDSQANKVTGS